MSQRQFSNDFKGLLRKIKRDNYMKYIDLAGNKVYNIKKNSERSMTNEKTLELTSMTMCMCRMLFSQASTMAGCIAVLSFTQK